MDTDKRTVYEFGDFFLESGQRRLSRRESGEPGGGQSLALTPKVFDTLLYLVEHRGETLDKDTLLSAIWPGLIVEENSLTQNISTLRQVLGETRTENRYIATVPRKGYRFVGEVTERSSLAGPSVTATTPGPVVANSKRSLPPWWMSAVALLVLVAIGPFFREGRVGHSAPPAIQTLAVLPFKPLLPTERDDPRTRHDRVDDREPRCPWRVDDSPLSSVRRYGSPSRIRWRPGAHCVRSRCSTVPCNTMATNCGYPCGCCVSPTAGSYGPISSTEMSPGSSRSGTEYPPKWPTSAAKPDRSSQESLAKEPYVFESIQNRVRFEADGKGQRDVIFRARIQSESSVREFGLLAYPFAASFETLDLVYARVHKPDGTIVETPASDVQETRFRR